MGTGIIRYDIEMLKASIPKLGKASKDLEGYNSQFLADITDTLSTHDSDFAQRVSKATSDMWDAKAPALLAAIEDYCRAVEEATQETESLDETLAGNEERIRAAFDAVGGKDE